MPFSGPEDPDIPDNVPEEDKAQFVAAFNNAFESCEAGDVEPEDDQSCESYAFAVAYAAISKKEEKKMPELKIPEIKFLRKRFQDFADQLYALIATEDGDEIDQERAISIDEVLFNLYFDILDDRPSAYVNGFYMEGSEMFAIISEGGKLYRASIDLVDDGAQISGEWFEVVLEFNSVEERQASEQDPELARIAEIARAIKANRDAASTTIMRTASGKWRWMSVSCSAVLNRSGAIDSRDLMDSFIDHIERGEDYPYRDFYHLGEQYQTGQADFLAREGYLLITSGIYDDNELAEMEIKARQDDPDYWGDSIEFKPTAPPDTIEVMDGVEIAVYTRGILRAISTLPENEASALFTSQTALKEVSRMVKRNMTEKQQEAFLELWDKDEEAARSWLEDNVDEVNRAIIMEGLVSRDRDDDAEDEPESDVETADQLDPEGDTADPDADEGGDDDDDSDDDEPEGDSDGVEILLDDETLPVLREALLEDERFSALFEIPQMLATLTEQVGEVSEQVDDIGARVEAVERTDEDKQEDWLKDLGRKSRKKVTVTHRAKIDAKREGEGDEDEDQDPNTPDPHVTEILKKVPKYT